MGRFQAAMEAAKAAVSSSSHASPSELDGILSILIQSMIKCNKSEELGLFLDDTLPNLPLAPFLLWQLSLIQAGKAEEARGRIETRLTLQPAADEARAALGKCLALANGHKSNEFPPPGPPTPHNNLFTMTGSLNDIDPDSQPLHQGKENCPDAFHRVREWIKTWQWLPLFLFSSQRRVLTSIATALFLFSLIAERKAITAALKKWWRQIRAMLQAFLK